MNTDSLRQELEEILGAVGDGYFEQETVDELESLIAAKVQEARIDELERLKLMFELDWPTVKNQVVYRIAELQALKDKEAAE